MQAEETKSHLNSSCKLEGLCTIPPALPSISSKMMASTAPQNDGLSCFRTFDCNACVQQNCTFCIEIDTHSCFDLSRWDFCGRRWLGRRYTSARECRTIPAAAESSCPIVDEYAACQSAPCHNGRQCCQVKLAPWLKHAGGIDTSTRGGALDDVTRGDILLKAMLAHDWLRNESHPVHERAYSDYLRARLGRVYQRVHYDIEIRRAMFRGLFESVIASGFRWVSAPVIVDQHFYLLDGAHRIAVALALRESRIGIARDCRGNVSLGMNSSTRPRLNMSMAYLAKILQRDGEQEVRKTWDLLNRHSSESLHARPDYTFLPWDPHDPQNGSRWLH